MMLGRIKRMFGSKAPAGPRTSPPPAPGVTKPRRWRVNLKRRFTVIEESASGSMSRVYRAMDNQSGRTVCLKVQLADKHAAAAARSGKAERPEEGEIASRIVHPHVVRTFDHGVSTRGEHYVVMEFIDGVSLKAIRESRATPLDEKLEMLAQAAEGLAAVHAAGFIHHDIGPKNYLVSRDGHVKLIDFGLAVPNTPAFQRPGNRTGTIQYMAPELLRREPTDERLDIFSFGVLAFEFLTNRLPYDATASSMALMLQRINQDPLDPMRANPLLPPELGNLLRQLIARRKEERWPRMDTLAEALRAVPAPRL
jgi:eukaryotic-like serine/threonine-protein kinase